MTNGPQAAGERTVASTVTSAAFNTVARSELSLTALATWDPDLQRDARLLVPVDVQALVVPAAGDEQAVPTETVVPVTAPGADTTEVLPRPPKPFAEPVDRAAGVHLHWAMPDGLTRGDAGAARDGAAPAGNPSALPSLPDRWVVVRLRSGSEVARSWILEADRGDVHDLAGWTEPGPAPVGSPTGIDGRRVIPRTALNAVAGGDVAWAATYDAVIGRFGFHDDLADLVDLPVAERSALTLSYLVTGWWSDPALDPLHDCSSAGSYHTRTAWLGWRGPDPVGLMEDTDDRGALRQKRAALNIESPAPSVGGYRTDAASARQHADTTAEVSFASAALIDELAVMYMPRGPAVPRLSLVHGAVVGVALDRSPDLKPSPQSLALAFGPTGYAALSAMLADGTGEQRVSSERLLAAFSSGLLSTIDSPSGLAAVDEDRHASGFTATSGGVRARPDRIAEGDVMAGDHAAAPAEKETTRPVPGSTQERAQRLTSRLIRREAEEVLTESVRRRFGEVRPKTSAPRTFRDVAVPQPRLFLPTDMTVLIRGANRSFRFGGDSLHTPDGRLACRLPSEVVRGLAGVLHVDDLPAGLRSLHSGAVPPEVDVLLREVALTDPYRWTELVAWATKAATAVGPFDANEPSTTEAAVTTRVKGEVALRYARPAATRGVAAELSDSVRDVLRRASLVEGVDVSPVGVTRWSQPWVPLWCDWELRLQVDDRLDRWSLGPTELAPAPDGARPEGGETRTVAGRSLIVSSSARALAGQIRSWLSEEKQRNDAGQSRIDERDEAGLAAAAAAADGLDVLTGTFRGVRETLLGLDPHDAARSRIDAGGAPVSKPTAAAAPMLLVGGAATVTRLRLVDCFGRWVDVPDDVLRAAEVATAAAHPDGAPSVTLTPRLQRPSRLSFRFVDPGRPDGSDDVEARIDQQDAGQLVSPVAGWLLPDHVDESLEFFDPSGAPLGQLMHDELTGAVVWEGAPGRPGPIGGAPEPGADPGARHVTRLAAAAVQADAAARNDPAGAPAESALSALLRAIDSTLWTVDPLGSLGTGVVAGLVGRPIAVVRAVLRLDVLDDLDALSYPDSAGREQRAKAYAELTARALTVRLGELTRTDDALLAYAVDDDYRTLRLVAPEVREQARVSGRMGGQLSVFARGSQDPPQIRPIRHPYVDGPTDVSLRPGHTVRLTLLMCPGGNVHATCGVLPRKSLALARDWFHDALVRLSPSFRIGPVLVDPAAVRLPMINGLGDEQAFTRRDTPLTWRDDPIVAASQTAFMPEQPANLQEGWIRVQQLPPRPDGATP